MKFHFHAKRLAGICAATAFLVFLFSYNLILGSGLIPGANKAVDQRTKLLEDAAARRATVEGQFVDCNGIAITEAEEPGVPAQLVCDGVYGILVGYNTNMYGTSGLRKTYYDDLYYGGKDGIGATIALTTNNDLQQYCYDLLGSHEGSVIVMNAETGALLACASRSSGEIAYTVNDIDEKFPEYVKIDGFFLNPATTSEHTGGSTGKIITGACMVQNGLEDYVNDDTGVYTVGSTSIHNYGKAVYGDGIDLQKAFNKSINTYFASAGVELNAKKLLDTATAFGYGQTLELDFATLRSTFNLENLNNKSLVAQTAYGQGKVAVSPLNVAMMMGAIVNDGKIMKPYLVQSITDDGKVEQDTKPTVAYETLDKSTAEKMQGYLHNVAVSYGFEEDVYGQVYAKTGTADQTNGLNTCYYLMGVETDSGKYVLVVNHRNTTGTSGSLKKAATDLLAYVVTMM